MLGRRWYDRLIGLDRRWIVRHGRTSGLPREQYRLMRRNRFPRIASGNSQLLRSDRKLPFLQAGHNPSPETRAKQGVQEEEFLEEEQLDTPHSGGFTNVRTQ